MTRRPGERTDRHYLLYGGGLFVTVAMLCGLLYASMGGALAGTASITAHMTDIGGGVGPGSDVKLRGVAVGRVDSVDGTPSHLAVHLSLDPKALQNIPATVTARVLPATVFGTSFLDLVVVPGQDKAPRLASGDAITQDTSAPTLELQKALDSIDRLVKALGPAQLSSVLTALGRALDGRGSDIGQTIDHLSHLLTTLNPELPLIQNDARLLATNMDTLRQVAPNLLTGLAATADVAHGLVTHADQARALLVSAIKLVAGGQSFLDATQVQFVRAILLSAGVSQAIYDNRTGISAQAKALDDLMTKLLTVGGGSPGSVRVDIQLIDPGPYQYYTSADCPRYGSLAGGSCR